MNKEVVKWAIIGYVIGLLAVPFRLRSLSAALGDNITFTIATAFGFAGFGAVLGYLNSLEEHDKTRRALVISGAAIALSIFWNDFLQPTNNPNMIAFIAVLATLALATFIFSGVIFMVMLISEYVANRK